MSTAVTPRQQCRRHRSQTDDIRATDRLRRRPPAAPPAPEVRIFIGSRQHWVTSGRSVHPGAEPAGGIALDPNTRAELRSAARTVGLAEADIEHASIPPEPTRQS